MINKGKGGGNTITGLNFERKKDIFSVLKNARGYSVKGNVIYYNNKEVARSYRKYGLYKYLESRGIDWERLSQNAFCPMKHSM